MPCPHRQYQTLGQTQILTDYFDTESIHRHVGATAIRLLREPLRLRVFVAKKGLPFPKPFSTDRRFMTKNFPAQPTVRKSAGPTVIYNGGLKLQGLHLISTEGIDMIQNVVGGHKRETPPKLLDQVRLAIRVRHYSLRTGEAYVAWIKRFIFFHGKRHPSEMGELRD